MLLAHHALWLLLLWLGLRLGRLLHYGLGASLEVAKVLVLAVHVGESPLAHGHLLLRLGRSLLPWLLSRLRPLLPEHRVGASCRLLAHLLLA